MRFAITNPMCSQTKDIFGSDYVGRASQKGASASVTPTSMSEDEVKDLLRMAKPMDRIEATLLESDGTQVSRIGTLIKRSRGRWSVEFDLPNNRICDGMIPDEACSYLRLSILPSREC